MAEPKGTKGKPSIKKPKHACATKVEHPEWGAGNCLKEQHTLDEDGTVTHYDVMFDHGLEQNVSINELNVTLSEYHEHAINDDKNKEVLDEGGLDPVNKKAVKKKFANRKDQDIDNDGDVDGSDKFLHKRRKAISKKMAKEHHQKDADGKVIEHDTEDTTPSSVERVRRKVSGITSMLRKKSKDLAKKGDKDYPKTLNVEEKGDVNDMNCGCGQTPCITKGKETKVENMKQARKNVGASSCWKGYKAKGTKMKGGKSVPNCVKEFAEWRKEVTEKK